MSAATEYCVRVAEGEVVEIRGLPSGKITFPLDTILKSSTFRNILADGDHCEEISLSFPTGACHPMGSCLMCTSMHARNTEQFTSCSVSLIHRMCAYVGSSAAGHLEAWLQAQHAALNGHDIPALVTFLKVWAICVPGYAGSTRVLARATWLPSTHAGSVSHMWRVPALEATMLYPS